MNGRSEHTFRVPPLGQPFEALQSSSFSPTPVHHLRCPAATPQSGSWGIHLRVRGEGPLLSPPITDDSPMRTFTMPSVARLQWHAVLHVPLLFSVAIADIPYSPTRILQHGNLLYVFQPSPKLPTQFQLSSIDISSRLEAAELPYTMLHQTLPFLDNDTPRAFTPVIDSWGNLTVYAGDCAKGASGGEVWNFTPRPSEDQGKGDWKQMEVLAKDTNQASTVGANYLSHGMVFSSIVGGDAASAGAYFFGGMCPTSNDSKDDWQSAANYSNSMITMEPPGSRSITYQIDVSTSRGPPVPEAGFTLTSLSPTFSGRSDGTQIQQQNFVLVGGHTNAAFINMSQVALFSLPEQSWTFIGIQPPANAQTNRAVRADHVSVDSRSGHSAVLTPDGKRIIVFGGWVGDINTPAEPQLVVLNVAGGYGGDGDWQWIVPSSTGVGPPHDSGLYGHGAAMLPGGVMMITGGYSTSHTARQARSGSSSKSYFFNVTSNTWVADYLPLSEGSNDGSDHAGPLSTTQEKVGLGVGLGLGIAIICCLFAIYLWYNRRLKRRREFRDKQLQEISFNALRYSGADFLSGFDERNGRPGGLDNLDSQNDSYYFPPGAQGGQGWRQTSGHDVERSGLLIEIPSPTRGLRRSLGHRPSYALSPGRGPGPIHSIEELEEEQEEEQMNSGTPLNSESEITEKRTDRSVSVMNQVPTLDPFSDEQQHGGKEKNTFCSAPPFPIREDRGHMCPGTHPLAEWPQHVVFAPPAIISNLSGRLSPDKSNSERTGSNLSEKSTRSNLSWTSSHAGVIRSSSMRSTIPNNTIQADIFRTTSSSPTRPRPRANSETDRHSPEYQRTQSFRSLGHHDMDLLRTSQPSFALLQAEGEALLGGNPEVEQARPGTASTSNTYRDMEGNGSQDTTATAFTSVAFEFSRNGTRIPRTSWLGTVRRVLKRSISSAERTRSLTTAAAAYYEPYTDNPSSGTESTKPEEEKHLSSASVPPRRAASDASFWRSRRGKQDWIDDEVDSTWRRNSGDDWGAPEDIVLAERERIRQSWRERGNLLIAEDERMPTPRTPIRPNELGIPRLNLDDRPSTPASEVDWDVEAAVERRVVQVMFTVPKSKLRVVNADADSVSVLSMAKEGEAEGEGSRSSRVKEMAGKFEQMQKTSPRPRPCPSPSASIRSLKVRAKVSQASLGRGGMASRLGEEKYGGHKV